MKQQKRIILEELNQWMDYRNTLVTTYEISRASRLPPRYLGKRITLNKIKDAKKRVTYLINLFNSFK